MRRLLPTVAILPWCSTKLKPPPLLPLAFCSTTSTEHHPEDGDLKYSIKAKLYEALERREGDVVSNQLHQLFKLKNVSTFDCNQLLEACWLHVNAQVAYSLWMFMVNKQIKLDTYSVACLLKALCRGGLLDEALKLLYKLDKEINVQPHIVFCSIFLSGCRCARSVLHAEKCLRYIKEMDLKEDELVYLELLKLAVNRNDFRAAHKAWILMVKCCKPSVPSLESYFTVIQALCQAGSLAEALITFKEMVQLISGNKSVLIKEKLVGITSLYDSEDMAHLRELQENTQDKEASETSNKEEQSRSEASCEKSSDSRTSCLSESSLLQGSTHTEVQDDSSTLNEEQEFTSTRLMMLNLQRSEASDIPESLHLMSSSISGSSQGRNSKVKYILRNTFNVIINAYVNKGDLQSAELLFNQMLAINLNPDMHSYNAMLRAVVRKKGLEQGFQLVKNMEESGLQPDTITYTAILEGFCSRSELDKAEALLERMLKMGGTQGPNTVTFNVLLKACGDLDDFLRALRIFSKMVEARIKPDGCTIVYLLSAFGRVNFPFEQGTQESQNELARRLGAIEAYMEHSNLPHNSRTYNSVLAALCTEGMTDAIFRRLRLAEGCAGGDGLPILDTITFNTAINACNKAKQWAEAKEIFKKMQVLGYKPNTETYNVFINGCAEQKKTGDAFNYLDTMQEVGIKPDLITFNTLIKVLCYSNQLDGAVNLMREMEQSGTVPNNVTIVTLLHCAVLKERMDIIEFLVEHMHRKGLQPNMVTCELVVSAYVNCHQIDAAAEALRVLSTRMLSNGQQSPEQMEEILKKIFLEDSSQVEASTLELLRDAMASKGAVAEALLAARLSGFGNAAVDEWKAEESWWAKRLKAQYIWMDLS